MISRHRTSTSISHTPSTSIRDNRGANILEELSERTFGFAPSDRVVGLGECYLYNDRHPLGSNLSFGERKSGCRLFNHHDSKNLEGD